MASNASTPQVNQVSVTGGGSSQANATDSTTITAAGSRAGVYYYLQDQIGSTRVITDSAGNVCYDADFYPYGGERVVTDAAPQNYKFTGQERDPESNLDNFRARYYTSQYGRFISSDPAGLGAVALADPQTLNRYAYVRNNPLNLIDPTGMQMCTEDCPSLPEFPDAWGDGDPFVTVTLDCPFFGQDMSCFFHTVVKTPAPLPDPSQVKPPKPQSPCTLSTGQRISSGIQGTLNAGIGGYKAVQGFLTTLAGLGLAPETGGVSLVGTATGAYLLSSGGGQAATGIFQLGRMFTGNGGPETTGEQYAAIASGQYLA